MTQKELKLPPNKKRKPNQQGSAASTPAQAQSTPAPTLSPQAAKATSTLGKKGAVSGPFKCTVVECVHNKDGFKTDAELVQHVSEAHKPREEIIEDALAFALSGMAESFGLDEHGKPKPTFKETSSRNSMHGPQLAQASASRQGPAAVKAESTPAAGATPMARGPSQFGGKSMSPGSNSSKTPQLAALKGAAVKVGSTDRKPEGEKTGNESSVEDALVAKDPWDESPVSLSVIQETFGGLESDLPTFDSNGLDELLATWASSDAYTNCLPDFGADYEDAFSALRPPTPTGKSSSLASNSPGKSSNASKTDGSSVPVERTSSGESWIDIGKDRDDERPVEVVSDGIGTLDLGGSMAWVVQEDEPWQELDWEKLVAEGQVE